jgi:hypothetical protein
MLLQGRPFGSLRHATSQVFHYTFFWSDLGISTEWTEVIINPWHVLA